MINGGTTLKWRLTDSPNTVFAGGAAYGRHLSPRSATVGGHAG